MFSALDFLLLLVLSVLFSFIYYIARDLREHSLYKHIQKCRASISEASSKDLSANCPRAKVRAKVPVPPTTFVSPPVVPSSKVIRRMEKKKIFQGELSKLSPVGKQLYDILPKVNNSLLPRGDFRKASLRNAPVVVKQYVKINYDFLRLSPCFKGNAQNIVDSLRR